MIGALRKIGIFVSSPGGLTRETAKLKKIIDISNPRWEREHGVTARLITFRDLPSTYAEQGVQGAINAAVFDQYEIYFGLMGVKFGTPTRQYGSGTEEEYQIAVKNHMSGRSPKFIAFGFSGIPANPFELDLDELKKVSQFRQSIQDKQLYYTWKSLSDFEQKAQDQLNKLVHAVSSDPVIGGARYGGDPFVG